MAEASPARIGSAAESASRPARSQTGPERRLIPDLRVFVALLSVAAVVVLGVFRNGAIFAADRRFLAVVMLAFGTALVVLALPHVGRGELKVAVHAWAAPVATGGRVAVWGLLALSVLSMVSSAWSLDATVSLWAGFSYLGAVVSFGLGTVLWSRRWTTYPLLLGVLTSVGGVVAWVSLVGHGLGWSSYLGVLEGQSHAQGPFGYANALAALVVLALPASAWIASFSKSGRLVRLFAGASAVFQVWVLVLTWSRGAVLALVGGVALLAAVRLVRSILGVRDRRWRVGLAALSVVGLVVLLVGAGSGVWRSTRPYLVGSDVRPVGAVGCLPEHVEAAAMKPMTTDGFRIRNWVAASRAVADRPVLGHGMATFYEAYAPYKPGAQTRYAHNLFVQYGVELGVVGMVVLVVTLGGVAVACARRVWHGGMRDPGVWIGVSVVGFLLQNMIDLTWYFPALLYLFWMCVGGLSTRPQAARTAGRRVEREGEVREGGESMSGAGVCVGEAAPTSRREDVDEA